MTDVAKHAATPLLQRVRRVDWRQAPLSLRVTLLGIIAFLNLLIAAPAGYHAWQAFSNLGAVSDIEHVTQLINHAYDAQKSLSIERGASMSALYTAPETAQELMGELRTSRAGADDALATVEAQFAQNAETAIAAAAGRVHADISDLARLRHELDAAVEKPVNERPAALADNLFKAQNQLADDLNTLISTYAAPYFAINPGIARRMHVAHVAWEITEYGGREYALLGRLIATGKYATKNQERDLLLWQGRIEYGWELLWAAVRGSEGGDALRPHLDEARNQFSVAFTQVKSIFASGAPLKGAAIKAAKAAGQGRVRYPVSVDMWLGLASQSVDALHSMMDRVQQQNRKYMDDFKAEAERSIWLSVLILSLAIALSVYSWTVIVRRVIRPVNAMADALDRASRGESYEMPLVAAGDDEIGKLLRVLAKVQENTSQLQAERDKAQAANVAKSEFLANMSHEIRTPMNVVLGLANILSLSKPLTEKQGEFVKTLKMSAESLLSIINDLLDFSKIETGGFELENIPFDLSTLITDVATIIRLKAKEKGLDIVLNLSPIEGRKFVGDPTRLRQVVTNLCSNAVKFTSQGSITITAQAHESAVTGLDDVFIQVTDTGVGIPSDKMGIIFDKFTQADSTISRKFGGTGLGLAIAKTFVEMMKGSITVDSIFGRGSTFTVFVPLPQDRRSALPRHAAEEARQAPEAVPAGARVLLVEDYAPNALVARVFLEEFGYGCDTAETGARALEIFAPEKYHAILMDVQMHGMDGYQVTQAIRNMEREGGLHPVRIIGMTAHALPGDREKCLDAGMDDYIAKPFRPDDLQRKLAF